MPPPQGRDPVPVAFQCPSCGHTTRAPADVHACVCDQCDARATFVRCGRCFAAYTRIGDEPDNERCPFCLTAAARNTAPPGDPGDPPATLGEAIRVVGLLHHPAGAEHAAYGTEKRVLCDLTVIACNGLPLHGGAAAVLLCETTGVTIWQGRLATAHFVPYPALDALAIDDAGHARATPLPVGAMAMAGPEGLVVSALHNTLAAGAPLCRITVVAGLSECVLEMKQDARHLRKFLAPATEMIKAAHAQREQPVRGLPPVAGDGESLTPADVMDMGRNLDRAREAGWISEDEFTTREAELEDVMRAALQRREGA